VFKVETQHVVMLVFTGSRVALLWVYMTVMCCEVERVQIEKGAGWPVQQIAVVWCYQQELTDQLLTRRDTHYTASINARCEVSHRGWLIHTVDPISCRCDVGLASWYGS